MRFLKGEDSIFESLFYQFFRSVRGREGHVLRVLLFRICKNFWKKNCFQKYFPEFFCTCSYLLLYTTITKIFGSPTNFHVNSLLEKVLILYLCFHFQIHSKNTYIIERKYQEMNSSKRGGEVGNLFHKIFSQVNF